MLPDASSLLVFMAAGLALNLTPGPDMLYVAARSTSEGRASGIASALGIGAGALVHIAALAFGLLAILRAVPMMLDAVRLFGAAYLIFLGARALRSARDPLSAVTIQRDSLPAVFRQGMITNILNPKVALFFLAFLPQFVDPGRGSPAAQVIVLGLLFNISGTLVNLGVAVAASTVGSWAAASRGGAPSDRTRYLRMGTGALFIALGVRLAVKKL